jgi:hypothetical protein
VGGLAGLAAAVDDLAAQDLDGFSDVARAERVLVLPRLLDRLEGHWLRELAGSMPAAPPAARTGEDYGWPRPGTTWSPSMGC